MQFTTADLWDDHPNQLICLTPLFQNYGKKPCFGGEIVTVKLHEDNSLVRETLGENGQGKVLVVDGGGSLRCALVGDRLAQKAINNGWEGIVVYGCIRDSAVINQMDIGIKALQTCPVRSIKRGVGLKGEVLRFAGAVLRPGQFIYGDADGLLVSENWLIK
ncbi:MAG: ribonuclease E activity regulator RraA [Bacteroidota bacterium]